MRNITLQHSTVRYSSTAYHGSSCLVHQSTALYGVVRFSTVQSTVQCDVLHTAIDKLVSMCRSILENTHLIYYVTLSLASVSNCITHFSLHLPKQTGRGISSSRLQRRLFDGDKGCLQETSPGGVET